jgi:protein arginine kinase
MMWYENENRDAVVLSTRVRLARNLSEYKFKPFLSEEDARRLFGEITEALARGKADFRAVELDKLSPTERGVLAEQRLISPELANGEGFRAAVFLEDEAICLMVNEEDHLRLQCLLPGLALDEAWARANRLDDLLEESLRFAFHGDYGYLTRCPTNAGTGLRASVMLHLPALTKTNSMKNMAEALAKLGVAARGCYGEGSEAAGALYQLSNQVTLGAGEAELLQKLKGITDEVVRRELALRQRLLETGGLLLEDKLFRAYGLLKNARLLTAGESKELLSEARLGSALNVLNVPLSALDPLLFTAEPAHIAQEYGAKDANERDKFRAEKIQKALAEY